MVERGALDLDGETLGNHEIFPKILQHAFEIYNLTSVLKWRERLI